MIPLDVEIFVALEPIDLRASFDRLSGLVRERMGSEPTTGALFVFFGKRKEKLKVLFQDASGLVILYKRLSRGTFRIPVPLRPGDTTVTLTDRELVELLEGLGGAPSEPRRRKPVVH